MEVQVYCSLDNVVIVVANNEWQLTLEKNVPHFVLHA
jgi:hypothetical protein